MAEKAGLFQRLRESLGKTRDSIKNKVDDLVSYYREINDEFFEELEAVLISSDVGAELSAELTGSLRDKVKQQRIGDPARIRDLLKDEIKARLAHSAAGEEQFPVVILMVGVNGTGKTTTSAKLAKLYKEQGKTVLLAAADTFRAAAVEQLQEWGRRVDVPVLAQQQGSDPAAVVFDAVQAAKARGVDVLICDTAGRLQNKKNLMNELEKIQRVVSREFPEARRESFLVLDATTGQNAVVQARTFGEVTALTGLVLTKLDGTAKGGIVIGISSGMGVPVRYVCTGERVDDIQPFDAQSFADALFDA